MHQDDLGAAVGTRFLGRYLVTHRSPCVAHPPILSPIPLSEPAQQCTASNDRGDKQYGVHAYILTRLRCD